jgi:hypothetical protein
MTIIFIMMHTSHFHLHKVPYFFYSSFLQMFGCFLGLGSFNSPKGVIACKEAYFLIAFGGIKLIRTTTIIAIAYLGSWDLGVSIIIVMFMVDQHPSLLEALTQVNKNTSKQHVIFYRPQHMCVFLLLNNSLGNKLFDFRIPSLNVCVIIPFIAWSLIGYLKPIVLKFYRVLALGWVPS